MAGLKKFEIMSEFETAKIKMNSKVDISIFLARYNVLDAAWCEYLVTKSSLVVVGWKLV